MKRSLAFLIGFAIVVIAAAAPARPSRAESLTDAKFRELHQLLQPGRDEPWRTIPWKIALLDAQRMAAQDNKPLFIWAMDGHPLGCT